MNDLAEKMRQARGETRARLPTMSYPKIRNTSVLSR